MDRRWAGAAVLLTTVLAVAVVSGFAGRTIGGSATALIAPPPVVGNCLKAVTPVLHPSSPQLALDDFDYPVADIGPCAGSVVGEIVLVDPSLPTPTRIGFTAYWGPWQYDCAAAAFRYLGTQEYQAMPGIVWTSATNLTSQRIGPDALQRAQGQEWAACVVLPLDGNTYAGTMRDVLATGRPPAALGWCFTDAPDGPDVPCDAPHRGQLIAVGARTTLTGPVTAGAGATCRDLAAQVLRAPDPTFGGLLRVELDTSRPEDVTCAVVSASGRELAGSLQGLGDNALPWAG